MAILSARTIRLVGGVAVAGVVLAGCSDDDDDGGGTAIGGVNQGGDASSDTMADGTETEAPAQPADGEATPPGTALSFGDSAFLEDEFSDQPGTLEVAVEATAGDAAELQAAFPDEDLSGLVPFFVTFTITNAGDAEFGDSGIQSDFSATLEDGSSAGLFSIIGEYEPCPTGAAPDEFVPGASYQTCRVFLGPEGGELASVDYISGDYDSRYYEQPVTWS